MFKIGEFSKLCQLSVRMLRYYDETGLLKPDQTDPFTGYRLYSAEQISDLRRILFLRDLGLGVAEISDALANWSEDAIAALLQRRQRDIEGQIAAHRQTLATIEQAKQDLGKASLSMHYDVTIKSVPGFQVFSLRRVMPDYYAEGLLWKEMAAYIADRNLQVGSDTFTIYHDLDYRETDVDMEVCAPALKMGQSADGFTFRRTEPVPIMASAMVYGPFENIAGAFRSVAQWLEQHAQYQMTGTSRQVVHRGPWNEEDPAQYLTEIQIPLELRP